MRKKILKNKKGFTVIEMLIAVFIFSVSLAALMFISARALETAREAEKQVIADYLALETFEAVRHIRDSAFLADTANEWHQVFDGHDPECLEGEKCDFYYSGYPILQRCSGGGCRVYQTGDNRYLNIEDGSSTGGLSNTGFIRYFTMKQLTSEEILVTVYVEWNGGRVIMHNNLFLWF